MPSRRLRTPRLLYISFALLATTSALPSTLYGRHVNDSGHGHYDASADDAAPAIEQHAHAAAEITTPGAHVHYSGSVKTRLDEAEVLKYHQPDTLSYYAYDSHLHVADPATGELETDEGDEAKEGRWPGLLKAHVTMMIMAWFVWMPTAIMLSIAKHPLRVPARILFLGSLTLGLSLGTGYNAATPDLYVGSIHGSMGWALTAVVVGLNILNLFSTFRAACSAWRSSPTRSFRRILPSILLGKPLFSSRDRFEEYEAVGLAEEAERNEDDEQEPQSHAFVIGSGDSTPVHEQVADFIQQGQHTSDHTGPSISSPDASYRTRRGHRPELSIDVLSHAGSAQTAAPSLPCRTSSTHSSDSHSSDHTLHSQGNVAYEPGSSKIPSRATKESRVSCLRRVGKYATIFLERLCLVWASGEVISGVVVYTGTCRAEYINGCMAHLIKGSIFFWYGLLTFGRYIGAFAEYGWAWNCKPKTPSDRTKSSSLPSFEFIESAVIFFYGSTNTWMERFGAHPGDPYTVKQVQHISIAVMFWFAGLMGMLLESRAVRRALASPIAHRMHRAVATIPAPPSYSAPFNPFPALCIGTVGIAMSAHAQEYEFQVAIHALWGCLLAGFAVLRCLTYFFLWLRPPSSVLPSRPPTEALAAVALACGGVVFVESTEQITFAAMRHGFDDMMAFLNVTVAFVLLVLAWILALMALKGWAIARMDAAAERAAQQEQQKYGQNQGPSTGRVSFVESPTESA